MFSAEDMGADEGIEDILGNEYDLDRLKELVEADKTLREFAEDVARQFGYHGTTPDGRPAYTTGGLSTLEWAWSILDWPDPKPAPECECQEEGCLSDVEHFLFRKDLRSIIIFCVFP